MNVPNKIVYFTADWCKGNLKIYLIKKACKQMKPEFDLVKDKYKNTWEFEIINVDSNRELVSRANIKVLPTFVVFKNGEQVEKIEGVLNLEKLLTRF
jgi:thioredoxin 1